MGLLGGPLSTGASGLRETSLSPGQFVDRSTNGTGRRASGGETVNFFASLNDTVYEACSSSMGNQSAIANVPTGTHRFLTVVNIPKGCHPTVQVKPENGT